MTAATDTRRDQLETYIQLDAAADVLLAVMQAAAGCGRLSDDDVNDELHDPFARMSWDRLVIGSGDHDQDSLFGSLWPGSLSWGEDGNPEADATDEGRWVAARTHALAGSVLMTLATEPEYLLHKARRHLQAAAEGFAALPAPVPEFPEGKEGDAS